MPQIENEPKLDIALSSNFLTVNGCTLRADVLKNTKSEKTTVDGLELSLILMLGRRTIVTGAEAFHQAHIEKYPDHTIGRPSIFTSHLGTPRQTEGTTNRLFTEKGEANGGVNTQKDELQPSFHHHWEAVRHAGFIPEVRRTTGNQDGGAWLLLRVPTLPDALEEWFGYSKASLQDATRVIADTNKQAERENLLQFRLFGEQAAETVPHVNLAREKIGLILAMAALKSTLGDTQGSLVEIDDAFEFADNDPTIKKSLVRVMEHSTYGM